MTSLLGRFAIPLALVVGLFAAPVAALAQATSATVPADPATLDTDRFFLDTYVSDVLVDNVMTVALMDISPRSPCPSNAYVYSRDNPKWLFETGRLLEAKRRPARIRISFSCVDGNQILNAVQFLEPPQSLSRATPTTRQVVRTNTATPIQLGAYNGTVPGAHEGAIGAAAAYAQNPRQIPLP